MPKKTFFNLPAEKRNSIISAAMYEFSANSYKTASINVICRESGIAKGSFYQYFADKLDLYVYIMTLAIEEKIRFFSSALSESNNPGLTEQIRMLFLKGVEFSKKHPLFAALGEQFSKEDDESAKTAVIREGDKLSGSLFLQMIHDAKARGEIDGGIDPFALSLLLQSLNSAVSMYMHDRFDNTGYEINKEEVDNFVDSLLNILVHGIRIKNSI